jgi:tripartite-type tricarboxylate transporter receptor subunit TctC
VKKILSLVGVVTFLIGISFGVSAQSYPNKPIRMIIPFSVGGSTDILARVIGQKLSENLGQQVVIENKGGANGLIGMDLLAKSPADGYTILFCTTSTLSINPSLYVGNMPYDPDKAFVEVGLAATAPNILVVNKDLPAKNVKELVDLAKKRGSLNAASGATMHLLNEKLFESKADAQLTIVPYKGTGPALVDLVGGQVDLMFDQMTTSLPFVQDGRLRALAVTSAKRFPALKEVPTMVEAGYPNFVTNSWWGILAPSGTSPEVVNKLNAALNKALTDPTVLAKIASIGGQASGGTPKQFADLAKEDRNRWGQIIKANSIAPE